MKRVGRPGKFSSSSSSSPLFVLPRGKRKARRRCPGAEVTLYDNSFSFIPWVVYSLRCASLCEQSKESTTEETTHQDSGSYFFGVQHNHRFQRWSIPNFTGVWELMHRLVLSKNPINKDYVYFLLEVQEYYNI
ncbi:hypothetical protein V1478_010981 [Vespula squamosa]|uniref:Ribosomal protein L10 n=1 Tax=Vespula squamosa TaxID=30214 RepID=A0ABD2AG04_VESSQ